MIVNVRTLIYELKTVNFIYNGFVTLKSADYILFLDMIGIFFVFKSVVIRCRGPPSINLDFKKFELIGGKINGI